MDHSALYPTKNYPIFAKFGVNCHTQDIDLHPKNEKKKEKKINKDMLSLVR